MKKATITRRTVVKKGQAMTQKMYIENEILVLLRGKELIKVKK